VRIKRKKRIPLQEFQSMKTLREVLQFIKSAEKLKIELRRGKTSADARESVADHCWRVSLIILILSPLLDQEIDVEKALKLSIVHDLGEILTGDLPYYYFLGDKKKLEEKHLKERLSILKLTEKLPSEVKNEIIDLWDEFERMESVESKFVNAIDKMEAQIQHNQSHASNWNQFDIENAPKLLDDYCDFDCFLTNFKNLIQQESSEKIHQINSNRTMK